MSVSSKGALLALGLACAASAAAPQAMANVIFDLSPASGVTSRSPSSFPGIGQGVNVAANTSVTDFALWGDLPGGGDVKLMIWNGSDTTLLFSTTQSVAASSTPGWIDSGPISFNLKAGKEYWFGIVTDTNAFFGYIFPEVSYSANGLSADTSGNSNYDGFTNPTPDGPGLSEAPLQISGGPTPAPEPAGWAMLIGGAFGVGAALRSRRKAQPTAA